MAKSLALLAVVIISVGISAAAAQSTACGVDETKDYCPADCASDSCPKGPKTVACARPNVCPPPQCKCRFNHRRAENGTCIPTRECPPFKCDQANEEYDPCPPLCPNGSCSQATPSGDCPPIFGNIGIVLECNPSCRCKKGYFWNEDKVCVPYNQCPCGVDETKHYCPADCASDYCPKGPKTVACARPNVCPPPQCKCRFNHRRAENGTCIPTRECPPFKCDQANEEYDPCPPLCPNGSCSQATPSGDCPPIVGNIGIVLECNPSCRCKKGYFWNEDKVCVPYNQCPGKSDSNASE